MSYTKLTDFAAKDALLSGNPSKLLRGTEIGAEFDAIESAMAALTVTPFIQTLLNDTDATAARATLGAQAAGSYQEAGSYAASGANGDITSLTSLEAGGLPNNSVLTADIADGQVTGAKIAASTITPDKLAQPLTLPAGIGVSGTTSTDITGIPSWAKRIVLQIDGVSTNGTPPLLVQLGTSGGVETSGYYGGAGTMSSGITSTITSTVGLVLEVGGAFTAGVVRVGQVTVTKTTSTNEWIMSGVTAATNINAASQASAGKVLSGTLDRIRITTTGGATFTAGAIFALID